MGAVRRSVAGLGLRRRPALVAAGLGAAQALGLVEVANATSGRGAGAEVVVAVRRLDGGRRERLEVRAPAVLSVEGSVARPGRAPLSALRAATDRIESRAVRVARPAAGLHWGSPRPIRPPTTGLEPPEGDARSAGSCR
ncbi:MAG: hypothetical protein R2698_07150 [Microthrixaceae bacterium]